mgnify:CR=1 FL=1
MDLLKTLLTSKTRVKLFTKFLLNPETRSYLRGLETEFGESSNSIRLELNKMEAVGILDAKQEGNRKYFQANTNHALFGSLQHIVHHFIGLDRIIDRVAEKMGSLDKVFLVGDYAQGKDSGIIDLVFVGEDLDEEYMIKLIRNCEGLIDRKIRYLIGTEGEARSMKPNMLIWENNA